MYSSCMIYYARHEEKLEQITTVMLKRVLYLYSSCMIYYARHEDKLEQITTVMLKRVLYLYSSCMIYYARHEDKLEQITSVMFSNEPFSRRPKSTIFVVSSETLKRGRSSTPKMARKLPVRKANWIRKLLLMLKQSDSIDYSFLRPRIPSET